MVRETGHQGWVLRTGEGKLQPETAAQAESSGSTLPRHSLPLPGVTAGADPTLFGAFCICFLPSFSTSPQDLIVKVVVCPSDRSQSR